MPESGKRPLLLEVTTNALNDPAEHHKILALLEWAGAERGNLEHAMGSFDLGEPEDPREQEETGTSEALGKNCEALEENSDTPKYHARSRMVSTSASPRNPR